VQFDDFVRSPNQADHPDRYEIENRAMDRDGLVLQAMREIAPWRDRVVVDLGCGSGYWLPGYAAEAARVVGVEPDPSLVALAGERDPGVEVLLGSAEHLPLPDASVDVVHARFAYFFPPGCDAGLAEVLRVLRPGGSLVVVDNDKRRGQFAEFLAASPWAAYQGTAERTDAWWAARGARRVAVMSDWRFDSRRDLETVLGLEFPADVTADWLARNDDALGLSYGYLLFAVTRPAAGGGG
jgi:ubiquinone/menaquinone biosynthesis C-methylase UbiE